MNLDTHAMRQCTACGTTTAHDRPCHSCAPVATAQPLTRCPGWGCPATDMCQRYLPAGSGPNTTPYLEPAYDSLFRSCTEHLPGTPKPASLHYINWGMPGDTPKDRLLDWPAAWTCTPTGRGTEYHSRTVAPYRLVVRCNGFTVERMVRGEWVRIRIRQEHRDTYEYWARWCWDFYQAELKNHEAVC